MTTLTLDVLFERILNVRALSRSAKHVPGVKLNQIQNENNKNVIEDENHNTSSK